MRHSQAAPLISASMPVIFNVHSQMAGRNCHKLLLFAVRIRNWCCVFLHWNMLKCLNNEPNRWFIHFIEITFSIMCNLSSLTHCGAFRKSFMTVNDTKAFHASLTVINVTSFLNMHRYMCKWLIYLYASHDLWFPELIFIEWISHYE